MAVRGNRYLTSRLRWAPEFGYMLHVAADRTQVLEDDLDSGSECSEEVGTVSRTARRKPLLCFLSFQRGWITHVARGEVRYTARSGRDRLDLWNVLALPSPVRQSGLAAQLRGGRTLRARTTLKLGGSLPPKAFEQLLDALRAADSDAHAVAISLIDTVPTTHRLPTLARVNWAYQRDAVMTALDLARLPRGRLDAPHQPDGLAPGRISIFDDVQDLRALEDVLVLRDLDGTPEWEELRRHRYPARTFESDVSRLTVILANKLPLERQLGVDLIYVNETLGSVVFVQYKVFEGEDGADGYRPDKQLAKEIARMDDTAAKLGTAAADDTCDGFRLGNDPFFFKFCRRLLQHEEEGLVPGHYLPLSYWKRLVKDPRVHGARGAVCVTPDNIGRHLTATTFKDLVLRGWIGATGEQAKLVLPALLAAMAGQHAVVLAVQPKDERPARHRRGLADEPAA